MSLKAIHIIFIASSVILCIGFGAWAVDFHLQRGNMLYLLLGITSIVLAGVLLVYGRRFLQKLKHVSYM